MSKAPRFRSGAQASRTDGRSPDDMEEWVWRAVYALRRWHGENAVGSESHKVEELDNVEPWNIHIQQVMRARWGDRGRRSAAALPSVLQP